MNIEFSTLTGSQGNKWEAPTEYEVYKALAKAGYWVTTIDSNGYWAEPGVEDEGK